MGLICPTVTAYSVEDFNDQMRLIASFSDLVHIDLMDGEFAKPISVTLDEVWWPENITATVHLMADRILTSLPKLISLSPSMVIVHAEITDDISTFIGHLRDHDIGVGIGLFQTTKVGDNVNVIKQADQVMLFSGKLGSFGGTADMSQLTKIAQIHRIDPDIQIGWDGGVTLQTVNQLSHAGVDVLYVGGAIHKANHPKNAYHSLIQKASN